LIFFVFVIFSIALGAMVAKADPVFPPMVGGEFQFVVMPQNEFDPDGIPFHPVTASIGIINASDFSAAPIGCVETANQSGTYEIHATVGVTGAREAFKAFAYSEATCGGLRSSASANTAYTYPGQSPHPPNLQ
jgi:hypothetical protein